MIQYGIHMAVNDHRDFLAETGSLTLGLVGVDGLVHTEPDRSSRK